MTKTSGLKNKWLYLMLIVMILCIFGNIKAADATIWTVTDTSDSLTNPANGSLRKILQSAWNNDYITFASGKNDISLVGELIVNKSVTISGTATIRQTAPGQRVFSVEKGSSVVMARFEYLTICNGSAANGAAILNKAYQLTLYRCALNNNSASGNGGGIDNYGKLILNICTIRNNSGANGGGIYNESTGSVETYTSSIQSNSSSASGSGGGIATYGTLSLCSHTDVSGNTPTQIVGSYNNDGTCTIGSNPGNSSIIVIGPPEGTDPEPRSTFGEEDVNELIADLANPESSIIGEAKEIISSDISGSPDSMSASLYNAFAYENIPLSDDSGNGSLEIEFTASWPENVRYYAAFSDGSGYTIPARGVQFEIKPGQSLPDGVTPPDFYEPGEGLMTWRNTIADNGLFDLNPQVGVVTCRIASIRAEEKESSTNRNSGAGCNVGMGFPLESLLMLGLPLLLLLKKK